MTSNTSGGKVVPWSATDTTASAEGKGCEINRTRGTSTLILCREHFHPVSHCRRRRRRQSQTLVAGFLSAASASVSICGR